MNKIHLVIKIIKQMLNIVRESRTSNVSDKWLVIYEVHQIIYAIIVKNTNINLYAWNKLAKYYRNMDFSEDYWLNILEGYLNTFLKIFKEHEDCMDII